MLESLLASIVGFMKLQNFLAIVGGITIGITIGAIPGMTATMAVALALPLTFTMNPTTGIVFLLGIYKGGIYGGSIPAILINTPGTPAASATTLDGYELAKQGKAGKALDTAIYASVIGDTLTDVMLILVAAPLASVALMFGPPEYAALILFSLTIMAAVAGPSLIKGLISGFLGLLLATIGQDPVLGFPRFAFGSVQMRGGLNLLAVLIGLFAIPEIITQLGGKRGKGRTTLMQTGKSPRSEDNKLSLSELKGLLKTIIRGGVIGGFIGAIPGTGAAPAAFISYNEGKRFSKHPEKFGKGSLEGVAAAEAGNNGVCGATMIPLLTLGIPGDPITAILLGAFMMQGLAPGPLLFIKHIGLIYSIYIGLMLCNLANLLIAKLLIPLYRRIINIPKSILFPSVFFLCVTGVFAVNNNIFDVYVLLAVGMLGFLIRVWGIPPAPLVITFILGPMFEKGLRRSLMLSHGSFTIFFVRPIPLIFISLTALSIIFIAIRRLREQKKTSSP